MKAVNLYVLTRDINEELLPVFEKCLSYREEKLRIRNGELKVIREITSRLLQLNLSKSCLDNWFYSFSIPQISKEFDLLKMGQNGIVVNIEIKEQEVEKTRITKQLIQNRYYLSNVAQEVYAFTCMQTNDESIIVYKLDKSDIKVVSLDQLKEAIELIKEEIDSDLENFFRPKDYLISPINTSDRFLAGEYFLNNHQEQIKNEILQGIQSSKKIWGIKGGAGTGKTLLLYDIAKSLSSKYKVGIIHSGIMSSGHHYLNNKLKNITIIEAKGANKDTVSQFDYICVDEAQRLYGPTLDVFLSLLNEGIVKGEIFSYDFTQCLSKNERTTNIPERLKKVDGFIEEHLTERIRTNKVLFSFIKSILRLADTPQKKMTYDCVDVLYANNQDEADTILDFYEQNKYKFITFTPSRYKSNSIDHYRRYENSHEVIGQEFDNVVIIIDKNFRYDSNGELEGREHPCPEYLFPKLFYQNITRAREKLCIIVLDNLDVFEKLITIKYNSLD